MARSTSSKNPGIELLKWLGAAAMLVEHVAHFVYGDRSGWPIIIGRAAFPLFAIALAAGVASMGYLELRRIALKLGLWGVVAAVAGLVVREAFPLNVLFTFALGVWCYAILQTTNRYKPFAVVALLLVSFSVEYGPFGVGAVMLLIAWVREPHTWAGLARLTLAGLLIAAVPFNAIAIAYLPIGAALLLLGPRLPRLRGAFYWVYILQWPLFAGVRAFV